VNTCPFCWPINTEIIILESTHSAFINNTDRVLTGSGMIVPKSHRETVFDLTQEEFSDTYGLLQKVKKLLDDQINPDGYNIGWNCYPTGGQTVPHAHLHVIPRFQDEPLAGTGIRHHLKQKENMRKKV
jgi:diadenosine tetraphosphate (Ap4A) HIT family hydrolase